MAACAKCGTTLSEGATFCGSCGAPVGSASTGAGPAPAAATGGGGLTANVAALLAYIFWPISSVLFLVLEPYNKDKFIRFHAFQSLFLGIAAIVLSIGLAILTTILAFIPVVGWLIGLFIWPIFALGMLALAILIMYKAYNNERYMIPVIGAMAAKQAG